jgi:hypothetical protein
MNDTLVVCVTGCTDKTPGYQEEQYPMTRRQRAPSSLLLTGHIHTHIHAHTHTHTHTQLPMHHPHLDNSKPLSSRSYAAHLGFPRVRWLHARSLPCSFHPPSRSVVLRCHADFAPCLELLKCLWYTPCVPKGKHTLINTKKCSTHNQSQRG